MARKAFYQNPFKAVKDWLSPVVLVKLEVEKEVLDNYVRGVALDPDKDKELGELPGLPDAPTQRVGFNASRPFDMRQLTYILKRKKASSRPGPNQIP